MIHPDNSVWFHDHIPNVSCNGNCYEQTTTAPIHVPWKYFIRAKGDLREVHPLTYPNKENRGTVIVEVLRTGEVKRVGNGELIIHR